MSTPQVPGSTTTVRAAVPASLADELAALAGFGPVVVSTLRGVGDAELDTLVAELNDQLMAGIGSRDSREATSSFMAMAIAVRESRR